MSHEAFRLDESCNRDGEIIYRWHCNACESDGPWFTDKRSTRTRGKEHGRWCRARATS